MDYVGLLSRWLHVLPAVMMGGGILFCRLCLADKNSTTSVFDQHESARKRWMMLVSVCTLLILLSGSYNFYAKLITYRLGGLYHGLFGIKLLLGLVIFYLAAVLAGRSETAKKFRQRETHWLNLLSVLVVVVILIGGYMKVISTDKEKKAGANTAIQESSLDSGQIENA